MDDDGDGGLDIRNWGYYEQTWKGNLGLHLMSSVVERDTKPLLSNGGFLHRQCGVSEPLVAMDVTRDGWIHQSCDDHNKILHMLPVNHHHHHNDSYYGALHDPLTPETLQMLQLPEPPKDDNFPVIDIPVGENETPLKKRSKGRPQKFPKPKKSKKVAASSDDTTNGSVSLGKSCRKSAEMVINGISLNTSGIPTPVCSCTGKPQPCYRWGAGGWQSVCCTTSISMYPLPMSTKRRGARIAGRKMSQGAFKKVLEKLTEEGHSLCNPIDLRSFWAKHGTNKFVTISLKTGSNWNMIGKWDIRERTVQIYRTLASFLDGYDSFAGSEQSASYQDLRNTDHLKCLKVKLCRSSPNSRIDKVQ